MGGGCGCEMRTTKWTLSTTALTIICVLGQCVDTKVPIENGTKGNNIHEEIHVKEGEDVTFTCPYLPKTKQQPFWFFSTKEGEIGIETRNVVELGSPDDFMLKNARCENAGYYSRRKPNSTNRICCQIKLVVSCKPTARCTAEAEGPVDEGKGSIRMHCSTHGVPTPHIHWYIVDATDCTNNLTEARLLTNSSILEVYNVTRFAAGVYVCVATNTIDTDSCSISLGVSGTACGVHISINIKIEMEVYEDEVTIAPHQQNVTLMCRVTGSSISASRKTLVYWARADNRDNKIRTNPHYTVYEDNELVQSHHTLYLMLVIHTHTLANAIGTYLCLMDGYSLEKSVLVK